jgi:hypothetical protein
MLLEERCSNSMYEVGIEHAVCDVLTIECVVVMCYDIAIPVLLVSQDQ